MSLLLTVTGSAPNALTMSSNILPSGTRTLRPFEISRHPDRARPAADLPHAVVEGADGEADDSLGRHLLAQVGAERPVDGLVRMVRRPERKRHLLDVGRRNDVPENAAHQREELNLSRHEHLQHRRVAARILVVLRERPASRPGLRSRCERRSTSRRAAGAVGLSGVWLWY